ECSSMATKYLGPQVDIHGGGSDLIFPHHTCEIAQSENVTGQHPFVSIWMHCAMVSLDGEKMSKSLGNLILVRNLLEHYTSDAIRVLLLSQHYRQPWSYFERDMAAAAQLAGRLATVTSVTEGANNLTLDSAASDAVAQEARQEFRNALNDDLNTPEALRILDALAGSASDSPSVGRAVVLRELADVLGLTLAPMGEAAPTLK
ncbi:MAG: class I tRNA ligase family protein, partial [Ktedonobacterales bacterium]